jgi:hypothetical protein
MGLKKKAKIIFHFFPIALIVFVWDSISGIDVMMDG